MEENKELDPFFSNLEDALIPPKGNLQPEREKQIRPLQSYNLQKPRPGILFLAIFIPVVLIAMLIFAPKQLEKGFVAPEVSNKLIINAPVSRNLTTPLNQAQEKFQVNPNALGKGDFYIVVADCSFTLCVQENIDALKESQLPYLSQKRTQAFSFVQVVSKQFFSLEEGKTLLASLRQLEESGIYPNLNSQLAKQKAGGRISLGLFSTLEEAKKATLLVNGVDFGSAPNKPEFGFERVMNYQKVTKILAGPFSDRKTAEQIQKSFHTLTSLAVGNILQLTNSNQIGQ